MTRWPASTGLGWTPPFIYLIERNPTYLDLVREVFRRITAGTFTAHSSVITLTEVLTQPYRVGNDALAQRYRRFLLRSRNFALDPITADMPSRQPVSAPATACAHPTRSRSPRRLPVAALPCSRTMPGLSA
jgi:hypothetical protein